MQEALGVIETLGFATAVQAADAAVKAANVRLCDLAKIGGGRIESNRIHVDSPSGTVDLKGSMGFDQTLAYDGQANLAKSASGQASPTDALFGIIGAATKRNVSGLSIPFSIRGTFSQPKVGPGRGLPQFSGTSSTQTTQQPAQPQEQKKKSIFDLFKKP